MVGHNFPDFIERWNRTAFRKVGYGLAAASAASLGAPLFLDVGIVPGLVMGALTAGYWKVGLQDMAQKGHAIRRNYPVLGNLRYIMEVVGADESYCVLCVVFISHR